MPTPKKKARRGRRPVRVVFLDIDGVLSGFAHYKRMRKTGMPRTAYLGWAQMIDERAVVRLNRIVSETGAIVVVSSSWRKSHPLSRLRRMLRDRGFVGRVVDVTPEHDHESRGLECVSWLSASTLPVESYVALDDEAYDFAPMRHRLVVTQTKRSDGLRDEHVTAAIRLLKIKDADRIAQWRAKEMHVVANVRPVSPDRQCPMPDCYDQERS